ncbi:MAG: 1,6-anhydro-N-acetylmuramyl-L-alanine amidase AmpD [Gammaproteobacteria bacterium]|nr:1,6-anhydro-N-acetylmuramyl-L-alanine amidase AmpD [Gammaproteobacteria bacterium]
MNVDPQTGLLDCARQLTSPNQDERPGDGDIDLLVIHGISLPPGEFGGDAIDHFFTNQLDIQAHPFYSEIDGVQVSSHLLIRRDGEIVQYVPFNKRAWHAGASCFKDRDCCNDFSIGIELEGTDDLAYENIQYEQLNAVITALQQAYPAIKRENIVGHCDIAPERKTDPGPAFDWSRV